MSDTKDTVQDAINVEVNRNCTQMLIPPKQAQICRVQDPATEKQLMLQVPGAFKPQ